MKELRQNRRRRPRAVWLLVFLAWFLFGSGSLFGAGKAGAAETATVTVSGVFHQTEARTLQKKINDFRAGQYNMLELGGSGAPADYNSWTVKPGNAQTWQRAKDGSVELVSGLEGLVYDYTLEKVAMLRALEIALYWDHNRPDSTPGYSAWIQEGRYNFYTAYPDGYMVRGENIAAGMGSLGTAASVMQAWMETQETYAGQGHRRNMLSDRYAAVGAAYVTHNGWNFWVQEFGSPALGTSQTIARNGTGSAQVTFSTDRVMPVGLYGTDGNQVITVEYGKSAALPDTKIRLQAVGAEADPSALVSEFYYALGKAELGWTIQNPSVASLSGTKILGKKAGTTRLSTAFAGETLSYTVEVVRADLTGASVTGKTVQAYTGRAVKPKLCVKLDGKTLKEGTDYRLSYQKNINTGTASVTVAGIGNYQGSVTKTFQIRLPVGMEFRDKASGGIYKVGKVLSAAKAEVSFVKPISAKAKRIVIPASVKLSGTVCKITQIGANALRSHKKLQEIVIGKNVTGIGKNAFRGASALRRIKIRTKLLKAKNVGANAFKGIAKDAVFKLPSAKKKTYRKLLLQKGARETMTFR